MATVAIAVTATVAMSWSTSAALVWVGEVRGGACWNVMVDGATPTRLPCTSTGAIVTAMPSMLSRLAPSAAPRHSALVAKPGERRCQLCVEIEADDWDIALSYLDELAAEIRERRELVGQGPLSLHTSVLSEQGQATAIGYERPVV